MPVEQMGGMVAGDKLCLVRCQILVSSLVMNQSFLVDETPREGIYND